MEKFLCQCCELPLRLLHEEDLEYHICEECYWEQESYSEAYPNSESGPNHISLNEAKKNYAKYGACDPHGLWCKTGRYPEGHHEALMQELTAMWEDDYGED